MFGCIFIAVIICLALGVPILTAMFYLAIAGAVVGAAIILFNWLADFWLWIS